MSSGCESKKSSAVKENNERLIDHCNDLTGLDEADLKIRTGLGYVKKSPVANMQSSAGKNEKVIEFTFERNSGICH